MVSPADAGVGVDVGAATTMPLVILIFAGAIPVLGAFAYRVFRRRYTGL